MPVAGAHVYEFTPDLRLRIGGSRSAISYFDREYGVARVDEGTAAVEIDVGVPSTDGRPIRDSHKTVGWEVSLGDPHAGPIRVLVRLRGRPRSFALSLVQGYVVEPVLAIAAVRTGAVLLPAAGLVRDDGALLVLGRSRSGKSSLSARALARGVPMLGDDQVLVDGAGRCLPFPRRLRAYGDLAATAPAAYARLPPPVRARIALRRAIAGVTRGYVAPSLQIPPSALGHEEPPRTAKVARVALVERTAGLDRVRAVEADSEQVIGFALELLEQQRVHLPVPDDAWRDVLAAATKTAEGVLRSALAGIPALHVAVPDAWPAQRAVPALAHALGIDV